MAEWFDKTLNAMESLSDRERKIFRAGFRLCELFGELEMTDTEIILALMVFKKTVIAANDDRTALQAFADEVDAITRGKTTVN
jgi:hypothetical protein